MAYTDMETPSADLYEVLPYKARLPEGGAEALRDFAVTEAALRLDSIDLLLQQQMIQQQSCTAIVYDDDCEPCNESYDIEDVLRHEALALCETFGFDKEYWY